jgi:hypothetical protein
VPLSGRTIKAGLQIWSWCYSSRQEFEAGKLSSSAVQSWRNIPAGMFVVYTVIFALRRIRSRKVFRAPAIRQETGCSHWFRNF